MDQQEPLVKTVERILDEESAYIARPNKRCTERIALAVGIAADVKLRPVIEHEAFQRGFEACREMAKAEARKWCETASDCAAGVAQNILISIDALTPNTDREDGASNIKWISREEAEEIYPYPTPQQAPKKPLCGAVVPSVLNVIQQEAEPVGAASPTMPNWAQPADDRPKRGGWAPGNYLNTCVHCETQFVGAKRAQSCADCAYEKAPSPTPQQEAEPVGAVPKFPGNPALEEALKKAVAAFEAMTPEEQEAHLQKQKESWVRGEMALAKIERGESCCAPIPAPTPPKGEDEIGGVWRDALESHLREPLCKHWPYVEASRRVLDQIDLERIRAADTIKSLREEKDNAERALLEEMREWNSAFTGMFEAGVRPDIPDTFLDRLTAFAKEKRNLDLSGRVDGHRNR